MNTLNHIQSLNIFKSSQGQHTSENYPWGYKLKTKALFFMEFNPKKGFRLVQITTNPKTGRECKPKKSTYCDDGLDFLYFNEENHVKRFCYSFNDTLEKKIEAAKIICHLWDYYTELEQRYLLNLLFAMLKVETKAMNIYSGFNEHNNINTKELLSIFEPGIKILVDCIKEHKKPTDFTLNLGKYDELKQRIPADYSPFKSEKYLVNFETGKLEKID